MGTSTLHADNAFTRKRVAAGVASASLLAGFSLLAAAPAHAATDADCTDSNTVTAPTDDAADIQALLDADTAIICLSGTFDVTSTLFFDYPDLTIHGLADAVLDGGGTTQILKAAVDGTLTIENMRFTDGASSSSEGAAISGYTVVVTNSQFDSNSGDTFGAIVAQDSATITDSVFFDNEGFLGGAVLGGESVTATNSTFTNNSALGGGAIFSYGVATVTSSTFTDNSAEEAGGAIAAYTMVTVNSSTFVDNSAGGVGGAILGDDGFSITNSTFVDNSADELGGAVFGSNGLVLQSTFQNNTATDGQAVATYEDDTTVRGNIFVGASAAAQLYNDDGFFFDDLGGNVFSTTQVAEEWLDGVQTSTQFSLSSAAVFAGATLADNGGPTQTVALDGSSPAVNAVPVGSPSVAVDQRGVARDALSDAGAYEFVGAVSPQLAATGSAPAGWLGGFAALFVGAGALALGLTRRARTR